WESVEIDLSEYSGKRIYIGFNLESKVEDDVEKPGIYIDHVALSADSNTNHYTLMNDDRFAWNRENTDHKRTMNEYSPVTDDNHHLTELPLSAEVSVQETGRSTKTDPSDGTFSISSLVPGDYTLLAESYGFHTQETEIAIEEDEMITHNFILEEKSEGTLSGVITDQMTGEPVEGATLSLVEDANVTPVVSNDQGQYELMAYEGTYTLKVVADGYHYGEVEVTIDGETIEQDVELEPYYAYRDDELFYDDGSMEGVWALYESGTSMAVRMSLPDGQQTAKVTDGVFQFEGPQFQDPDGGAFAVEVWDASGTDGLPGEKIAGPIDAEAIRDPDEWTVIDLSDENIIVDDDFYMVYVQTEENEFAPLLGVDRDEPYAGRTYQGESGI